jgi:hypothetical protein
MVCVCSATDVFTLEGRNIAFLLLELFLVAIKRTWAGAICRGESGKMTGTGTLWQQASPAAEQSLTSGGQLASMIKPLDRVVGPLALSVRRPLKGKF